MLDWSFRADNAYSFPTAIGCRTEEAGARGHLLKCYTVTQGQEGRQRERRNRKENLVTAWKNHDFGVRSPDIRSPEPR